MFGGNKEDAIRKSMGADLQNLSEQIGKLRAELATKNAEIDKLHTATQAQQAAAQVQPAATQAQPAATTQGTSTEMMQRNFELQQTQARLHELEKQLAAATAGAQPPTAAAQPAETAPATGAAPGQQVVSSGAPGLTAGSTAYVAQAGGLPLRLRSQPGLHKDSVIDKLQPGTQMSLLDGPQQHDGHSWWHIRASDGREGWVAGEDLRTQPE